MNLFQTDLYELVEIYIALLFKIQLNVIRCKLSVFS